MSWFKHDSTRIYFEELGSGTPVLFMPGLTQRFDEFAPLIQLLADAGYHVVAADLPGSGRSEPQPRIYTVDYYQKDAQSFTALLKDLQVPPAHILGYSDGGETALLIAIQARESVRSLVILGAAGALRDPDGQMANSFATLIDDPIPPLVPFRDHLVSMYGEANARAGTQNTAKAFSEIIENGGDISQSRADEISCPVLVVAGEYDPFATRELVTTLTQKIPNVRLEYLEGVGHDLYGERTDWLTQTILDWLAAH